MELSKDIYSIAYASLINPETLNKKNPMLMDRDHNIEFSILKPIEYNKFEVSKLYLSCIMIITIQITMIGLIIRYMFTCETFYIQPAKNFLFMVPRFLSSMLMHINVGEEVRGGLMLIKWALNHPSKFTKNRKSKLSDGPPEMSLTKVLLAILLGLL